MQFIISENVFTKSLSLKPCILFNGPEEELPKIINEFILKTGCSSSNVVVSKVVEYEPLEQEVCS